MYAKADLAVKNLADVQVLCSKHASMLDSTTEKALQVTKATVTPSWWALWVLFRYRTVRDWFDLHYLLPRIADKAVFCFIIFSL